MNISEQKRRWSALALIVTAQFMVILDVAIVNVALLDCRGHAAASSSSAASSGRSNSGCACAGFDSSISAATAART